MKHGTPTSRPTATAWASPPKATSCAGAGGGKEFARGAQAQWLHWPGRHLVQLLGERGEVLDEMHIEVRGAGVKATFQPPAKATQAGAMPASK